MKRLIYVLMTFFLLFSCQKEQVDKIERNVKSGGDKIQSLSSVIDSNFFDIRFVYDSLDLVSNKNGYVSGVKEIIRYYKTIDTIGSQLTDFENLGLYPCWYCTEADHFDALNFYTPFYELSTGNFVGLLITRKEADIIYSVLMMDELSKSLVQSENETIHIYVDKVFDYFRGDISGKNIRNYSGSRNEACIVSDMTGGCVCQSSGGDCIDYSSNDHEGGIDCLSSCGGGSGDNGISTTDPYDNSSNPSGNGSVGSCYFCGTYSVDGNNGGAGNSSPPSQFNYIERQHIVSQILNYIDQHTNIYINLGNQLALSNETHFDYTTYLLFTNMEYLSEEQIEAYIQLITHHRHFITDSILSNILLFNDGLSNSLDAFLSANNSSDASYRYGKVITILSPSHPWNTLMSNAQSLLNVENQFSSLTFSDTEIEHILTFEPQLISDIQSFLENHGNDPLAIKIVHDFINLQQCDNTPCIHIDYDNKLEAIYDFYSSMADTDVDWLNILETFIKEYNISMPIFDLMTLYQSNCTTCNSEGLEEEVCAALTSKEIDKLKNNIVFLSTDNNDAILILNNIASSICPPTSGINPVDAFYDELNKNDFIVLTESFKNNSKANCVWIQLFYYNIDLFKETLANFSGPSRINLYLFVENIEPSTASGYTDKLEKGGYGIVLNENYVEEALSIEILKTILHEAIHAEILRRQHVYTISELENIYPEMMAIFNDDQISDFHHEYMASFWFDDLLESIQNFYPPEYNLEPIQFEAIAWSGLHKTNVFEENSEMTIDELTNILESIRQNSSFPCDN